MLWNVAWICGLLGLLGVIPEHTALLICVIGTALYEFIKGLID